MPPAILNNLRKRAIETTEQQSELDYNSGAPSSFGDVLALDTETVGLNPRRDRCVGISFSQQPEQAYYLPLSTRADQRFLPSIPTSKIIAHNWQFDGPVLRNLGWDLQCDFDTMLAAYVLQRPRIGLKSLSLNELGVEMTGIDDLLVRKEFTMADAPPELVTPYACADADMTLRLYHYFKKELEEAGLEEIFELEMAVLPMLIRMSDVGVGIDTEHLKDLADTINDEKATLLANIRQVAGDPDFNPDSGPQLSKLLFEKLGIEPVKSTNTPGQFSTDKMVLTERETDHPIIRDVLDYREMRTLLRTFVEKLPEIIDCHTKRIHTQWKQATVVTGRLSSANPNLQNIPVRGKVGDKVRAAFIPAPGYVFVGSDYKALEVRVMAHLSKDERLIDAIRKERDPHKLTASVAFSIPYDDVPPVLRDVSKTIFFAAGYGAQPNKIAHLIRTMITDKDASQLVEARGKRAGRDPHRTLARLIIEGIYDTYRGLARWQQDEIAKARKCGYSSSLLGRRRSLPYINHSSEKIRSGDERIAMNHPVQSTASGDILKRAMAELWRTHGKDDWWRPWGQIHDELQSEVPEDKSASFLETQEEIMEGVMQLEVPLKVDSSIGHSWAETH